MKHLLLLILLATPALGHKGSDAYWALTASGTTLSGRLDVALKDLDLLIGLDGNGDGKLTWGEVKSNAATVRNALTKALAITQGGHERMDELPGV